MILGTPFAGSNFCNLVIEKKHWWNCSRRDFIYKLIHANKTDKGIKILDIGCSTGILIEGLYKLTNAEKNRQYIRELFQEIRKCKILCMNCHTVETIESGQHESSYSIYQLRNSPEIYKEMKKRLCKRDGRTLQLSQATTVKLTTSEKELKKHSKKLKTNLNSLKKMSS